MEKHWKDLWEEHAEIDRNRLDALPVEKLISDIYSGEYGSYYNVWYSIAERTTIEDAGWVLFDVLNRDIDYLYRYHCAAALLKLLINDQYEPVQLSGEHSEVPENIMKICSILESKIGARPEF